MIFRQQKLNHLLLGAIIATIAIPLLNIFVIFPQFKQLQINNIENAAIRLAKHMEVKLREIDGWDPLLEGRTLSSEGQRLLSSYIEDFDLEKIKVFTGRGVVVYSTEKADIGTTNQNSYFHDVVAGGKAFSKVVKEDTRSLENQTYRADVVEVYVPSMQNGQFGGAFELYYDITENLNALESTITFYSLIPFLLAGFLLCTLVWGMLKLDRSLLAKEKAEAEVKQLQGTIPICSFCKKIRDDHGDWNMLEKYITEHSEAQFSHGVCEKCMQEQYPAES